MLLAIVSMLLFLVIALLFLQKLTFKIKESIDNNINQAILNQQNLMSDYRKNFDNHQLNSLKILQDTLHVGLQNIRGNVKEFLNDYAEQLGKRIDSMNLTTQNHLKEINNQVEKKLAAGFEKTTETFTDVVKRLALIDAAQKHIMELSNNVVSLQEILNDKKARGAFGEVQLSTLIRNVLPEQHFSFQHTLSNKRRADCILFLPEPTGNIAIDAKFPLENYRILTDQSLSTSERSIAENQFKKDLKKHINDIADKYIIPGETADGAMMFIPAESIFAEIHSKHCDVIDMAHRLKVWLVSPTTMMAILTTARAVLKDTATRKQLNIIQEHLRYLSSDFKRFQKRMDDVAQHIAKAHNEVEQVNISARKITNRFGQIEQVDLNNNLPTPKLDSVLPSVEVESLS